MGCCNQSPQGGGDLKFALKFFGVVFLFVMLLVMVFG